MKATNLSICVPYKGCDKKDGCANYCVSKMTGLTRPSDFKLMDKKAGKVRSFAKACGVTSVSMTGKGEPCLNMKDLLGLMGYFHEFPIELQTNGLFLSNNLNELDGLSNAGLDVIAISIDKIELIGEFILLFNRAKSLNLITRITVNITDLIPKDITIKKLVEMCKQYRIDQLSVRNIVAPNHVQESKYTKWIEKHGRVELYYDELSHQAVDASSSHIIRELPYGAVVSDWDGIAVTTFDYCVQDSNHDYDIRSLIFQEDGHLYTSWNSKASVLF